MKTLLIYEIFAEETRFYEFTLNEEELEKLSSLHGVYSNLMCTTPEEEDLHRWLSLWLEDHQQIDLQRRIPFEFSGEVRIIHTGMVL